MKLQKLKLGDIVTVNENFQYHGDWTGEEWVVVGLNLEDDGTINVTIAERWHDVWDQRTDGFKPSELTLTGKTCVI